MQALRFQMWGFQSGRGPGCIASGTRFRPASSRAPLRDEPSARAGSFFKPLDDPLLLSRMPRPGADGREAKLLQELSDIARMKVDAEPFGNDTLEIDAPPPDDAIFLTVRAGLHDLRKLNQLFRRQRGLGPSVRLSMRPSGPKAL